MEQVFKDYEILKLAVLAGAFVLAVAVCIFVVVRESIEMDRRRKAKRMGTPTGKKPNGGHAHA